VGPLSGRSKAPQGPRLAPRSHPPPGPGGPDRPAHDPQRQRV